MAHRNSHLSYAERFEMKVDRSGECHRWTGSHAPNGYGGFKYKGRKIGAHVAALLLADIVVPSDMTVDHVYARGCRHRDCVRLDHLEIVPAHENLRRGTASRTHCRRGHPYTEANTIRSAKGRKCRTCTNAKWREMYWRRKEATA